MRSTYNIGFISFVNPADKRASSGTCHTIYNNLCRLGNVKWIPINPSSRYYTEEKIGKAFTKVLGKRFCFEYTNRGAKLLSKSVDTNLFAGCDVLIAFFSGPITAYLDCKGIPVIYLSDAAFNGMVDYYPAFCNLLNVNIRQAIKNEIKSFEACSAIVLSADWSKNFALQIAPQCEGKVHVIELGANIKDTDIHPRQYKYDGHLHLLFLGVDWNRKGGDLAVEATRWLNNHGVKTTLHIIGIRQLPSSLENDPAIDYIGFLNKNIESDYKRLVNEIYRCHALLLPTKAECSGIAFAEASAFGLPIFTHDTGGIPNYVYDGRNGYKLPLGSSGADFAQRIYTCIENGELEKMAIDAPNVYSEKLNWNTWTQRMGAIIQRLLG